MNNPSDLDYSHFDLIKFALFFRWGMIPCGRGLIVS